MTIDRRTREGSNVIRRILVGYDGSESAAHALRIALDVAEGLGGEVVVLTVLRIPARSEDDDERRREEALSRENASRGLDTYRSQAEQRSVGFHQAFAESSDPPSALASYAKEHGFDLLVIGEHGRERSSHIGLGNAVEKLLRMRPCPILIV
jgi:nucleotide-binding universal stress UspA family protein